METDKQYNARRRKAARIRKGSVVRLRRGLSRGVRTARVLATRLTFGNVVVKGACHLDAPLGGLRYWHVTDLEKVR